MTKRVSRAESELDKKRHRVSSRLEMDRERSETGAEFASRVFEIMNNDSNVDPERRLLAVVSTAVDRVDQDKDRHLGERVRLGAKQGAEQTNQGADQRHRAWQDAAEERWRRKPNLSKSRVAQRIAEKLGGSFNTIRQVICKPAPEES